MHSRISVGLNRCTVHVRRSAAGIADDTINSRDREDVPKEAVCGEEEKPVGIPVLHSRGGSGEPSTRLKRDL